MGGAPSTEASEHFELQHQTEAGHERGEECHRGKPHFADWRVTTIERRDEKTNYDMLILQPNTILFHGTNLFFAPGRVKSDWYGTFDTAVQYAFRRIGTLEGEQGKVIGIRAKTEIPLFKISYRNLERLITEEKPDKQMKRFLGRIFGMGEEWAAETGHVRQEPEGKSLTRHSDSILDSVFAAWLCERGFLGYAAHKFGIFHSEVYVCPQAIPLLAPLPIEWRNHGAFPNCIFEVDAASGEPLTLFDGTVFGGLSKRARADNAKFIPKNDKFINIMRQLHAEKKIPPWWLTCPCSSNANITDDALFDLPVYPPEIKEEKPVETKKQETKEEEKPKRKKKSGKKREREGTRTSTRIKTRTKKPKV